MAHQFSAVTLLITHYNRSRSLERLLQTFAGMQIKFGDIVVSDDGSKPEHLNYITGLAGKYNFRLITTPVNKGLGNNINKGQDAVNTPFTLYIQEDFDPYAGYQKHLQDALLIMAERADVDLVRFYGYFKYPYLIPFKYGYDEMVFKMLSTRVKRFHIYSDHPHLRRSTFFEKFGRYSEGLKGDRTEFLMALSFIRHQGKAMIYKDIKGLFNQVNTDAEPSTMTNTRSNFRQSDNLLISAMRVVYRNVKHTYELLSYPKK